DADYWVNHARNAVRFTDAIQHLATEGVTTYIELGPDAVLTAMAQDTLTGDGHTFAATLRRDRDETRETLTALAHLHARGTTVDWNAFYTDTGAHPTPLPTYAFQHQPYWTDTPSTAMDATHLGQTDAEHPLLGAVVGLAGGDELVLTGRVSLRTHPWVADHDVLDVQVLPAAAFVDLLLRAAREVGSHVLERLTLTSPLVLPETGGTALQIVVGASGEDGRRTVECHSRAEGAPTDAPWVHHATGLVVPHGSGPDVDLAEWPPPGAQPLHVADGYERLLECGYAYGPVFQGLKAAWRRGDEIFAEIDLPEDAHADAGRFGIHPALLDAAAHVRWLGEAGAGAPLVPMDWNGVSLHAAGATSLRVRIAATGPDTFGMTVADGSGRPVLSVESLVARPVSAAELHSAAGSASHDALFTLEWQPLPLPVAAAPTTEGVVPLSEVGDPAADVPEYVLLDVEPAATGDVAADVRTVLTATLDAVRSWSADARYGGSRLVVATRNSVAVGGSDAGLDLTLAPVWGLVRAAQGEHPDRFVLVDLDGTEASDRALTAALATGEPELALRDGELRVPRLARVRREPRAGTTGSWSMSAGTVLVTGGTQGAGALVARHLVAEHGARRLLLTADVAVEPAAGDDAGVVAELRALGADVRVEVCDAADREAMGRVVASVSTDHPLCAVVHTGGAETGTALIDGMTPQHLDAVLRAQADAAWVLHEVTRELHLGRFLLVSSSAGVLHGMGQGGRAAAATFLDALARHRTAHGLPSVALGFGPWRTEVTEPADGSDGTAEGAGPGGRDRSGLPVLSAQEGLRLFDTALGLSEPSVVPVRLDIAALRAEPDDVPPVLSGVVRLPARPRTGRGGPQAGAGIRRLLAGLTEAERDQRLLELVVTEVAAVLEHDSAADVEPDRPFQALGFDSLAAIELRRRLSRATGLQLPATLVFDHPTAQAVAGHLSSVIEPEESDVTGPVLAEVDRLEAALLALSSGVGAADGEGGGDAVTRITTRLEALMRRWSDLHGGAAATQGEAEPETYEAASDDELFRVLDSELGLS
ncbi:KR domain-containing protein, partial [Streptomyces viridiviolaceus]